MSETATQAPGAVAIQLRAIAVDWPDGSHGAFPFAWLRDSCTWRPLHRRQTARAARASTVCGERGERHLQGCYADIDGLRSTLAVLSREAESV